MNREIYFCLDSQSYENAEGYVTDTYKGTERYIHKRIIKFSTTSISHLSFDLLDKGYDIYLCYQDKQVKTEPGMNLHLDGSPCKEIRRGHNLLKLFLGGTFNEILGIEK